MCFCKIPISRGRRLYSSEYSEPGYRRSVSKWLFIIFEILNMYFRNASSLGINKNVSF
nr:MAG TPA: hypothetical protein [Caudoviricetes sp.]